MDSIDRGSEAAAVPTKFSLLDRYRYRMETIRSAFRATGGKKSQPVVVERDHTVILGWSKHNFTIVSELIIANSHKKYGSIVILAPRNRAEMEAEIRARIGHTGVTRIVCRTGNPTDPSDLRIASARAAKSIIVVSPDQPSPDLEVIKTLLALVNDPERGDRKYHITAEIRDSVHMDAARLIGKGEVQLILASDFIARIAVQTCRQSGLSVVYQELLDFDGDEIYFHHDPRLVGKSFGESLFAFEKSTVIGIRRRDGQILLNPPMSLPIQPADKMIVIARDDTATKLAPRSPMCVDESVIRMNGQHPRFPEQTLILGWNRRVPLIIRELDEYVPAGSRVTVVADTPSAQEELMLACHDLKNQTVTFAYGDSTNRAVLDEVDVKGYHHILVAGYSERLSAEEADAKTLLALLHLRNIAEEQDHEYSITSEMLDIRNHRLAQVASADDFIVSHNLVSLLLSQISENRELSQVFSELFCSEGSEIYLRPAEDYLEPGKTVDFYTVVESAKRRNEVAIGYRLDEFSRDSKRAFGVRINPDKSNMITLGPKDKIIVLAER